MPGFRVSVEDCEHQKMIYLGYFPAVKGVDGIEFYDCKDCGATFVKKIACISRLNEDGELEVNLIDMCIMGNA